MSTPVQTSCQGCGVSLTAGARFCARCGRAVAVSLVGRVLGERYRLVHLLGGGGMGQVYRAEHVQLGRPFAIKVLAAHLGDSPLIMERFRREALAAGAIVHPHVGPTLDLGQDDGQHYLVMELIDGPSLEQLLEAGPLPVERAIELARQVASALVAVHAAGIVHRDIKPANVVVGRDPRGGDQARLVDFGLAHLRPGATGRATAAAVRLTAAGAGMGTPAYVAPEQIQGLPVDGRADLYALGATLFELLTGRPPFEGQSPAAVLHQHLERSPPLLTAVAPALAAGRGVDAVEALLLQLLGKRPDQRPRDAGEVEQRLVSLLDRVQGKAGDGAQPDDGRVTDKAILDQLGRL